jgi:hypothetical protein
MVRSDSKNTSSNKELEIFLSGKVTCWQINPNTIRK